jgi:hypothetical protein
MRGYARGLFRKNLFPVFKAAADNIFHHADTIVIGRAITIENMNTG